MNRTTPFSALSTSFMSIYSCITDTLRRKGWLELFEEKKKGCMVWQVVTCFSSQCFLHSYTPLLQLPLLLLHLLQLPLDDLNRKKGAGQSLASNAEHRSVNAVTHTELFSTNYLTCRGREHRIITVSSSTNGNSFVPEVSEGGGCRGYL